MLLLDEPAAGLSPSERSILSDIIQSLPRELPIVLIDHDMDLVLKLVDSITVLSNGKLLAEGSPEQIRANEEVRNVYFGKARSDA
jgi:branched-chain amino acid transport system ATP-binding protein